MSGDVSGGVPRAGAVIDPGLSTSPVELLTNRSVSLAERGALHRVRHFSTRVKHSAEDDESLPKSVDATATC